MILLNLDIGTWLLHLDWFKINLIIIIILVILIVVLRLLKYLGRWGPSKPSNISINKRSIGLTTEQSVEKITYYEIQHNCSRSLHKDRSIVIFTPYLVGLKKFTAFASGFTEAGYSVFLFQSKSVLKRLYKSGSGDIEYLQTNLQNIIKSLDVEVIICSDLITPTWFDSDLNDITKIFSIRPIETLEALKISNKIPFSYKWIFTLLIRVFGAKKHVNKSQYIQKNDNLTYLLPEKTIYEPNVGQKVKFSTGGIDFKGIETIVFATILAEMENRN